MAQGIHSFAAIMVPFLRLTLQMSCGNPSYKSQLKLTTKPVAVPSPSKLSLKTITAPPSPAKLSLIIMLDIQPQHGQKNPTTTFLLCLKYLKLCPEGLSLTNRHFRSYITLIVLLSKQISTFKFQPINRKIIRTFN